MCQLALPIKKTNYHHVQELDIRRFVAGTPPKMMHLLCFGRWRRRWPPGAP